MCMKQEEKSLKRTLFVSSSCSYKKEHKKAHLEYCKHEGIKAGDPRARYKYEEPEDLFAVLDDYDEDTKFLYGYNLIFKHAEQMTPLLRTVVSADAAHLQEDILGTAFGTLGHDANKHIVCLGFSVIFDNESKDTWSRHLGTIVKKVPSIDVPDKLMIAGGSDLCTFSSRVLLLSTKSLHDVLLTLFGSCLFFLLAADADKGFNSAFPATFNGTGQFSCSKHKGDNLVSHGNKGDRAVFDKAIRAKSDIGAAAALKQQEFD